MLFIYCSFFLGGGLSFIYSQCIQCCLFIFLFSFFFYLVEVFFFSLFFFNMIRIKRGKNCCVFNSIFFFQEKYVFFLLFLNCYDHVSFSLLDCFLLLLCCGSTSTVRINDHVGTVT